MRGLFSSVRRHPWRTLSVSVLLVVGAGAFLNREMIGILLTPDDPVDLTLPLVEPLAAQPNEVVYRVDASRSVLTVGVDEILAGAEKRVELTTHGITGDIGVSGSAGTAPTVRLSDVGVDVAQLKSDNGLRDKVLHHEFLESHDHPQVRLQDATVTLPTDATGTEVDGATLSGTLVVKDVEKPVTWTVDATVDGDTLTATADAKVTMSEFGVGPISKVGLVRTGNDVDLKLKLVAVDGREFTPPTELTLDQVDTENDGEGPSFAKDVRPILENNCASCHQPGKIGSHTWTLTSAQDASEVADGLAIVTKSKFMPPWPASELSVPFAHPRGLTTAQIKTVTDWAAAGGKLDVDPKSKVKPSKEDEVPLPRADKVVKMAEPYQGSSAKRDDYRCFILDPQVTAPSFLTGFTFDPDQIQIVHHAIVTRVRTRQLGIVQGQDAGEAGPGWSCPGGMGAGIGDRVAGWVPGQRPADFADGDGFDFQPGDVLVAQIHYHYDKESPADQSGMTLEFAKDPTNIRPLQSVTLIGPVEIPCPAGGTGVLCDRAASVAEAGERFGPAGAAIPNLLHRLCGTTPEQLAAASDGVTSSTTCDYPMRSTGEIISVLGHMHEIGSGYRMTLNPGTPEEKVLLDIPVWNFNWQLSYAPVDPVPIEKGDTVRVTCNWDRKLRYDPDPRYIVFAEGTQDEMCFSTLTIRPPKG